MPSIDLSPSLSLRKRAIFAGAWNLGALVTSQAIRLGGNLIMARLLMPEMFGIMIIATTVSVVMHLLSDVGLRQNIIQSPRGDDPEFLNTVWTVQIVRGFVLFALTLSHRSLCLVCASHRFLVAWLHLCRTGIAAGVGHYRFYRDHLRFPVDESRRGRSRFSAKESGARRICVPDGRPAGDAGHRLLHPVYLVAGGRPAWFRPWSVRFSGISGSRARITVCSWDRAALDELVVFGRWILLSSAVGVLAMHGDRICFGGSMSVTELGVYSIAGLILGAIQTGVQRLVGAVALPAFSEAARTNDFVRLRALYYRFKLIIDIVLLFICGLFWVTSPLHHSACYTMSVMPKPAT